MCEITIRWHRTIPSSSPICKTIPVHLPGHDSHWQNHPENFERQSLEAAYSYDDEISIAGRINRSSKVAIVANTPFLKQFDNLKKIHLTDVPLGTHMIYMVYSKKNFITATVESFANFIVAHCLDLPPES